ncbi:MAG: acyltransferase [Bacteroidota bacterium]
MLSHSRNFGLDLVRAIAICLVLLCHFAQQFELFGFWGVEIFFGLSGFLIGQILWRNFSQTAQWTPAHIVNFWSRRWWRTIPNYFLFFIISIVTRIAMGEQLPTLSRLTNFLWFGQDLLHRNDDFYGVSWSLCVEEWFYLLFPVGLLLVSMLRLKHHATFLMTLFLFLAGSVVSRTVLSANGEVHALTCITLARLDAIGYGVAAAFVTHIYKPNGVIKLAAFFTGLVLIAAPFIYGFIAKIPLHQTWGTSLTLTIVPIGASLLLPHTTQITLPTAKLGFIKAIVEKLSLWSYSIYLSHVPILFSVYALTGTLRVNTMGNLLSKIAGLGITILVSALIYKYFELPFTKKRPAELPLLRIATPEKAALPTHS